MLPFQQKRRLDLITIGSLDRAQQPKTKRRVVAIMARVHPGESPASFVCQGNYFKIQNDLGDLLF